MAGKRMVLDTSGKRGYNGNHGSRGISSGGNGRAACDGGRGGDAAKDISVELVANPTAGTVQVVGGGGELPLGDSMAVLELKADGGDGGHGGNGGDGRDGLRGKNGRNANSHYSAQNGGNGGRGGSGGDGGNGGRGGDAKNITLTVSQDDMDLFMLAEVISNEGGAGGSSGCGGSGGRGGPGGLGGSGWSGHKNGKYVQKPKAHNGRRGPDGRRGREGVDGMHGADGKQTFVVKGLDVFSSRYDVKVASHMLPVSDDGIIEPGETLDVESVTLKNCGGMPTPIKQPLEATLLKTKWVVSDSTVRYPTSIPPGKEQTQGRLVFCVPRMTASVPRNTAFVETAELKFSTSVTRVNKRFASTAQQPPTPIEVRYPIEISILVCPKALLSGCSGPFSLALRNISTKPIGHSHQRNLEVRLASLEQTATMFFRAGLDGNWVNLDKGVTLKVDLPPDSKHFIQGEVKFADHTKPHTSLEIGAECTLGERYGDGKDKAIQCNTAAIKMSEDCRIGDDTDLVLVVNHNIQTKIVDEWRQIAGSMGLKLAIWDVSIYGGLDFNYTSKGGESLMSKLSGKVVIIINNTHETDQRKSTTAMEYLGSQDIHDAGRRYGVSTYIISKKRVWWETEMCNTEVPSQPLSSPPVVHPSRAAFLRSVDKLRKVKEDIEMTGVGYQKVEVLSSGWGKSSPNGYLRLQKMAEKIVDGLSDRYPMRRYIGVCDYNPELVRAGCVRSEWKLGTVEIRPLLDTGKAGMCCYDPEDREIDRTDDENRYNVARLLPFDKKLRCLEQVVRGWGTEGDGGRETLLKAILSELAQEQFQWRLSWFRGPLSKKEVSPDTFRQFAEYDFRSFFEHKGGVECVEELVARVAVMLREARGTCEAFLGLLLPSRGATVTRICTDLLRRIRVNHPQLFAGRSFAEHVKAVTDDSDIYDLMEPFGDEDTIFSWNTENYVRQESDVPMYKKPQQEIVEEGYASFTPNERQEHLVKQRVECTFLREQYKKYITRVRYTPPS